jgi:hypothetical protein
MKCPKCGFDTSEGMNFCGQCGERLRVSCPSCGAGGQETRSPCTVCGHVPEASTVTAGREGKPVSAPRIDDMSIIRRFLTPQLSDKILAARGRIEGERRQVTVLFADIKGHSSFRVAWGRNYVQGNGAYL